jgi:hypothetical protein
MDFNQGAASVDDLEYVAVRLYDSPLSVDAVFIDAIAVFESITIMI